MRRIIAFSLLTVLTSVCMPTADASEPVYSLDQLTHHPYRYVPAYGHASQNPGSPKWFRPGYGYQIPGFGSTASLSAIYYHQNVLHSERNLTKGESYWTEGRAPWYLPGSPPSFPLPQTFRSPAIW